LAANNEKKGLLNLRKKDVEKKDDKKKNKAKKPRRSFIRYIKDVIGELKKVTWPTRKEFINATVTVIAFVLLFAIIVGLIDLGLSQIFNFMIGA